ncbi:MAG: ATP-binding protein [Candidatus Microthrix subdominans]
MTRRLLLGYLAVTLVVLLALEIPLAFFYSQREQERFTAAAERDAVVLASYYEDVLDGGAALDPSQAERYADRTQARVVVTDTDGISVLDTDAAVGRNFSTRPEVAQALAGERASGIRHSKTLNTDLLYVAVPVASGGSVHGMLRLTVNAHEVTERIRGFWLSLVAVAAVVLGAVAVIGWAVARSVTRPLRELQASARRFAEGDLSPAPVPADAPEEIAALADTMGVMATRLDGLLSAQRAFVSDASHQLRSPLTALRLRLENLSAELGEGQQGAEVEAAIDETRRLADLVSDLLKLARADQPPPAERTDVAAIAADRIDTWSAVADGVDVTLRLDRPDGALWASAVPGSVEQILDNLLDNALQVSPAGQEVTVTLERAGDRVRLRVADRGLGLNDAQKARALERFWRGAQTTPGTGLGLPIAVGLTEASGGGLSLADRPGGGLLVELWLPCSA